MPDRRAQDELAAAVARSFAGVIHPQDDGEWAGQVAVAAIVAADPSLVLQVLVESGIVAHVVGGKELLDPDGEWRDCTWFVVSPESE